MIIFNALNSISTCVWAKVLKEKSAFDFNISSVLVSRLPSVRVVGRETCKYALQVYKSWRLFVRLARRTNEGCESECSWSSRASCNRGSEFLKRDFLFNGDPVYGCIDCPWCRQDLTSGISLKTSLKLDSCRWHFKVVTTKLSTSRFLTTNRSYSSKILLSYASTKHPLAILLVLDF